MPGVIARRDLMLLIGMVAGGWTVGKLIAHPPDEARQAGDDPAVRAILDDRAAPSIGPASADLVMQVFTDYRCPACRRADPAMHRAVAADGRVRLVYRDWPIFGDVSRRAARVALASGSLYPAVHRALMAEPRALTDAVLRDAVTAAGGEWNRLRDDLERQRMAIDARLDTNARAAATLGLEGTPAYLVGPLIVTGAMDADGFARIFDQARSAQQQRPPPLP